MPENVNGSKLPVKVTTLGTSVIGGILLGSLIDGAFYSASLPNIELMITRLHESRNELEMIPRDIANLRAQIKDLHLKLDEYIREERILNRLRSGQTPTPPTPPAP